MVHHRWSRLSGSSEISFTAGRVHRLKFTHLLSCISHAFEQSGNKSAWMRAGGFMPASSAFTLDSSDGRDAALRWYSAFPGTVNLAAQQIESSLSFTARQQLLSHSGEYMRGVDLTASPADSLCSCRRKGNTFTSTQPSVTQFVEREEGGGNRRTLKQV